MKSAPRGRPSSGVEVTNVSPHGFWLLLGGREIFLSFKDFPWFEDATIAALVHVVLAAPDHLFWPDLDVDLATESIDHPDRYPLVSQSPAKRRRGAKMPIETSAQHRRTRANDASTSS